MSKKEELIKARNKIVDNPFKYYNPWYRYKLRQIDMELDLIEMAEYYFPPKRP